MKKCILLIMMVLVLASLAMAAEDDICEEKLTPGKNCTMLTPSITCTTYNYTTYNRTSQIDSGSLSLVSDDIYSFVFNASKGDYIIKLCDGSTREIIVEGEDNMIYFTIMIVFLSVAGLIIFSIVRTKQHWLKVVLSNALALVFVTILRFCSWFLTIIYPEETALIHTLDIFYAIAIRIFYFLLAGSMIYLIIIIVNALRHSRRKKHDQEWDKWE